MNINKEIKLTNYYKNKNKNQLEIDKKQDILNKLKLKLDENLNKNLEIYGEKTIFGSQRVEKISLNNKISSLIKGSKNLNNISNVCIKNKCYKKSWKQCKDNCFKFLHKLVSIEINSTAYMLKILANSLLKINSSNNTSVKLKFIVKENEILTGIWNDDKYKIDINKPTNTDGIQSILIMGLGPSASGKTYWAKSIIKMLKNKSNIKEQIPEYIMTIDGGSYREYSIMYQKIKNIAKKIGSAGLNSLVKGSGAMIFSSTIIKNNVIEYLKMQKHNIFFGFYVPETLGLCPTSKISGSFSCYSTIEKFLELIPDKDKWIGLMIYQHLNKQTNENIIGKCPFTQEFQCIGCFESGSKREVEEGKKYSNSAYSWTLSEGFNEMLKAPMGRFLIHNSGGHKYNNGNNSKNSKSIILEFETKKTRGWSGHSYSQKIFRLANNTNTANYKYIQINHKTFMKYSSDYRNFTNLSTQLQKSLDIAPSITTN